MVNYKHHIEFSNLQEGAYFASRIVIDEAAIKNYVKSYRKEIKEWCNYMQRRKSKKLSLVPDYQSNSGFLLSPTLKTNPNKNDTSRVKLNSEKSIFLNVSDDDDLQTE